MAGCYYMMLVEKPPRGVFPRDEYFFDCEHDPTWCAQEAVEVRVMLSLLDRDLLFTVFKDFAQRWRAKGDYFFSLERSLECSAGFPPWAPAFEDEESCHFGWRRPDETPEEAIKDLLDSLGSDPEDIGGQADDWEAAPIYMRPIRGMEADEMFCGEYKSGWALSNKNEIDALPFWEVTLK